MQSRQDVGLRGTLLKLRKAGTGMSADRGALCNAGFVTEQRPAKDEEIMAAAAGRYQLRRDLLSPESASRGQCSLGHGLGSHDHGAAEKRHGPFGCSAFRACRQC